MDYLHSVLQKTPQIGVFLLDRLLVLHHIKIANKCTDASDR